MTNEIIFFTQIASIVVFIIALFGIYRSLVSQKDGVIEFLREEIRQKENRINELQNLSPDVLTKKLSERVEASLREIERLSQDSVIHEDEIKKKENEIREARDQMFALAEMICEAELVCPHCNSLLVERAYAPIYGHFGGREAEGEIEIRTYECGLAMEDNKEVSPCKGKKIALTPK